ncbi:hypothetical protein B0H13DRAFT_2336369 [Mycena leptocephala]|nr:hypothetical protein B0H13DRAFT_2336369 [Mycena leptocephala]
MFSPPYFQSSFPLRDLIRSGITLNTTTEAAFGTREIPWAEVASKPDHYYDATRFQLGFVLTGLADLSHPQWYELAGTLASGVGTGTVGFFHQAGAADPLTPPPRPLSRSPTPPPPRPPSRSPTPLPPHTPSRSATPAPPILPPLPQHLHLRLHLLHLPLPLPQHLHLRIHLLCLPLHLPLRLHLRLRLLRLPLPSPSTNASTCAFFSSTSASLASAASTCITS